MIMSESQGSLMLVVRLFSFELECAYIILLACQKLVELQCIDMASDPVTMNGLQVSVI